MPAIITMQMPMSRYHGCLQFLLTQMPISCYLGCLQFFLMWMPVFCYHGCLQILLMQKEVILLTQFIGPSFYFLTSMRCWAYFPAPTILGIRGSLRCVISLLISWESQLTSAHPHTGRGRYRGLRPNSYLHLTNANILSSNAA